VEFRGVRDQIRDRLITWLESEEIG
jgi:hypothetical protein